MRAFDDFRAGLRCGLGDGGDFRVGVGREPVDGNDGRDAEFLHVLDMPFQIGKPVADGGNVLRAKIVPPHAAMHLQRADGGDDHGGIRFQPRLAALDIEELLRPQIGAEAPLP